MTLSSQDKSAFGSSCCRSLPTLHESFLDQVWKYLNVPKVKQRGVDMGNSLWFFGPCSFPSETACLSVYLEFAGDIMILEVLLEELGAANRTLRLHLLTYSVCF